MAPGPRRDISKGATLTKAEPSLRDAAAWWLADIWFGKDREGVKKAHDFVNVLEQTPAGLATFIDDVGSAFGRGDYVNGLLTAGLGILPGRTPALHVSPRKFSRFDIQKVLSRKAEGTGVRNQGEGIYFMERDNPSKGWYADMFTQRKLINKDGKVVSPGVEHPYIRDYVNKNFTTDDNKARELTFAAIDRTLFPRGTPVVKLPQGLMNFMDRNYGSAIDYPNIYDVSLNFDDPRKLPQFYSSLDAQPDNVRNFVADMARNSYRPQDIVKQEFLPTYSWNDKTGRSDEALMAIYKWPTGAKIIGRSAPTEYEALVNANKEISKLQDEKFSKPVQHYSRYYNTGLAEKYREADIPGHRYFDPESAGINSIGEISSAGDFNNYVITDPSRIKIENVRKARPEELTWPNLFGDD